MLKRDRMTNESVRANKPLTAVDDGEGEGWHERAELEEELDAGAGAWKHNPLRRQKRGDRFP
jgi:hypothetical protein